MCVCVCHKDVLNVLFTWWRLVVIRHTRSHPFLRNVPLLVTRLCKCSRLLFRLVCIHTRAAVA